MTTYVASYDHYCATLGLCWRILKVECEVMIRPINFSVHLKILITYQLAINYPTKRAHSIPILLL